MTGLDRWERVQGWIRHAGEDARIALACLVLDPPACGGAAYHCQQAAEKLLKGFLVQAGVDFRKTHDLDTLGEALSPHFPALRPLLTKMGAWTPWSVAYRYPEEDGPEPDPSIDELSRALETIAQLDFALRSLAPPVAPAVSDRGDQ